MGAWRPRPPGCRLPLFPPAHQADRCQRPVVGPGASDDAYAARVEGEYGKTEMWYVVDCEPGARLIYGVNCGLTKGEFRRHIEEDSLPEICNQVPVHPGDVFFIPAGTLHAIGAGILIAEVQQNSNTTYRVSDYGRLGPDSKPRALHVDKAVDVTVTVPPQIPYGAVGRVSPVPGGSVRPLASCGLFTAELLTVEGQMRVGCSESFTALLCLEGRGRCCGRTVSCRSARVRAYFCRRGWPCRSKEACGCCAAGYKGGPAMPTLHVVLIEPEIPRIRVISAVPVRRPAVICI